MKLPNLNQRVTLFFPFDDNSAEGDRRTYFEADVSAEYYPLGGSLDQQAPGYALGEQARVSIRWPCVQLPQNAGRSPERVKTSDGRVWQVVSFQDSAPPYRGYKSIMMTRSGQGGALPNPGP